mmetsp:Transcript_23482/g.59374  ORF Transcript_23482/g.59374 Transcript_23482/m.59374 type:complete len:299 (+) Transcript_23482:5845-6741(+)
MDESRLYRSLSFSPSRSFRFFFLLLPPRSSGLRVTFTSKNRSFRSRHCWMKSKQGWKVIARGVVLACSSTMYTVFRKMPFFSSDRLGPYMCRLTASLRGSRSHAVYAFATTLLSSRIAWQWRKISGTTSDVATNCEFPYRASMNTQKCLSIGAISALRSFKYRITTGSRSTRANVSNDSSLMISACLASSCASLSVRKIVIRYRIQRILYRHFSVSSGCAAKEPSLLSILLRSFRKDSNLRSAFRWAFFVKSTICTRFPPTYAKSTRIGNIRSKSTFSKSSMFVNNPMRKSSRLGKFL